MLLNKNPLIHENGLYYGKFSKEEYDEARKFVTSKYEELEKSIKGTQNVRENIGKMPQFPSKDQAKEVKNLLDFFAESIKTTGPISLSAFMRQCLIHPEFGYYTTRNPLDSRGGDFITSPEVSSVFGEMIGIWLFTTWKLQGSPSSINVVEFGPGKGTLMHDAMNVFNRFVSKAGSSVSIQIVLVEASRVLRKEQWKMLCDSGSSTENQFEVSTSKWGDTVKWVDTEKDIPVQEDVASYVLAHEFFDALPVKSFVRTANGWRELLVEHTPSVINTQGKLPTSDEAANSETLQTEFHLTMSPTKTPSSSIPELSTRFRDLPEGSRVEICADAEFYISHIVNLIGKNGAALIVDYGPKDEIPLNSLRGIYKHKFVSPFYMPGEVDLSVDVDFQSLKEIATPKVDVFGPAEQGDWLHELGIGYRFDGLIKKANLMANKELLYDSYIRLTAKDDKSMGKSYKVMALLPKGSERPAGFGTE